MSIFSSHKAIRVTPDQLREQAENLRNYADSAGDIFDQMQNRFQALEAAGAWKGMAFDEMARATALNVTQFEDMESRMTRLADLLDAVANKMQETDAEIQAQIDAAYTV